MREILFRGKRWDNGEWVCGDLLQYQNYTIIHSYQRGCRVADDVDPRTVGQYTGLTDKNGKKIFEGDIVDASNSWWDACGPAGHNSPIIQVEWNGYTCGFDPFADYDCDCGVYICGSEVEIIGNIHDNPELLEDYE